jgi:hypothetical protein
VPSFDPQFEQFIADSFDSEEAVMIVLALRKAERPLSAGEVLDELVRVFGLESSEERRLAEKRVELRMRDLAGRGLVHRENGSRFTYQPADAEVERLVDQTAAEFEARRSDLNRLIYGAASRARRLAEAFRF